MRPALGLEELLELLVQHRLLEEAQAREVAGRATTLRSSVLKERVGIGALAGGRALRRVARRARRRGALSRTPIRSRARSTRTRSRRCSPRRRARPI
jgi:hypothetical protein